MAFAVLQVGMCGSKIGGMAFLLAGEKRNGLTNTAICTTIHSITMAEVADDISTVSVWQLPIQERGFRRRVYPVPKGAFWGCAEYAQNCHLKRWSADRGLD